MSPGAPLAPSVVVPLYNEQENVRELVDRLVPVLERADQGFEIVFVDDGSRDQTSDVVRVAAAADPRVKLVRFARNYGQEAAVQAGILHARGRWIIQMDGDLQNPPEELEKLLAKKGLRLDARHCRVGLIASRGECKRRFGDDCNVELSARPPRNGGRLRPTKR